MAKKNIRCADVVPGCSFTAEAPSEEELLKKVAEHACKDHGMKEVPADVLKHVKAAVREA